MDKIDGNCTSEEDSQLCSVGEVKKLIKKAILEERERIANRISDSFAQYETDWDSGESKFSWDRTVAKLAEEILNEIFD